MSHGLSMGFLWRKCVSELDARCVAGQLRGRLNEQEEQLIKHNQNLVSCTPRLAPVPVVRSQPPNTVLQTVNFPENRHSLHGL